MERNTVGIGHSFVGLLPVFKVGLRRSDVNRENNENGGQLRRSTVGIPLTSVESQSKRLIIKLHHSLDR